MIKHIKLAVLFLVLQSIAYLAVFFIVIWIRPDCTVANDFYCTSGPDPSYLPIFAFLVLPPLIVKLLLQRTKHKVSWRRILAIHATVAIILIIAAFSIDSLLNGCGCGGE
jgi:hypothetical protein